MLRAPSPGAASRLFVGDKKPPSPKRAYLRNGVAARPVLQTRRGMRGTHTRHGCARCPPPTSRSVPRKQFGPRKLHQSARGADGLKAVTFPAGVTGSYFTQSHRRPPSLAFRFSPIRLPHPPIYPRRLSPSLPPARCFRDKTGRTRWLTKDAVISAASAGDVYDRDLENLRHAELPRLNRGPVHLRCTALRITENSISYVNVTEMSLGRYIYIYVRKRYQNKFLCLRDLFFFFVRLASMWIHYILRESTKCVLHRRLGKLFSSCRTYAFT